MTEYQESQLRLLLAKRDCESLFDSINKILDTPDPHPLEVELQDIENLLNHSPSYMPILNLIIHPELTTEQLRDIALKSHIAMNRWCNTPTVQNQDYMIASIHESIMSLCKVRK